MIYECICIKPRFKFYSINNPALFSWWVVVGMAATYMTVLNLVEDLSKYNKVFTVFYYGCLALPIPTYPS